MTLSEALKPTGKARRSCWDKDAYVWNQDGMETLSLASAIATDWEPYEEPPKKRPLLHYRDCYDIPVVEECPERDAVVKAAVALTEEWKPIPATWAVMAIRNIYAAVEAWRQAGEPE